MMIMGIIVNPRGPCGSGKTELVRRIMDAYGWRRGGPDPDPFGRGLEGYRLRHPGGGRTLAVLGGYAATSGGCDRIRIDQGGLPAAVETAGLLAAAGHDVLMEGLRLSGEIELSLALARRQPLHVLVLDTPAEACARNLLRRRRAGRGERAAVEAAVAREIGHVEEARARLSGIARVRSLSFDDALAEALRLLGVPRPA